MRTLVVGECTPDHLFNIKDPAAPTEAEFEVEAVKALTCVYPQYHCAVFDGTFALEGRRFQPDIALVARDWSHWFVIEVELTSHSFEGHVLPQVRAFRYGDPQPDCASILASQIGIDLGQAETIVHLVPRSVAVVANVHEARWEIGLRALDIQLLTVSVFTSPKGVVAYDIQGTLSVTAESLGFGQYSATDRALRFPLSVRLPDGEVEIEEPSGLSAVWVVTRAIDAAWITKKLGRPGLQHNAYLMLARTYRGQIILRCPTDDGSGRTDPRGRFRGGR